MKGGKVAHQTRVMSVSGWDFKPHTDPRMIEVNSSCPRRPMLKFPDQEPDDASLTMNFM